MNCFSKSFQSCDRPVYFVCVLPLGRRGSSFNKLITLLREPVMCVPVCTRTQVGGLKFQPCGMLIKASLIYNCLISPLMYKPRNVGTVYSCNRYLEEMLIIILCSSLRPFICRSQSTGDKLSLIIICELGIIIHYCKTGEIEAQRSEVSCLKWQDKSVAKLKAGTHDSNSKV